MVDTDFAGLFIVDFPYTRARRASDWRVAQRARKSPKNAVKISASGAIAMKVCNRLASTACETVMLVQVAGHFLNEGRPSKALHSVIAAGLALYQILARSPSYTGPLC
jgi:hypothetical protein